MHNYKYDVAISFAGEQRIYAEKLVKKLNQCGLKVFYDNWESTSMWGSDLTKYLAKVYTQEALYTITIFSKEYIKKFWTKLEFEIMQSRQYKQDEYILPITIDGTIPENWPKTRGYIESNEYSIDEIALKVRNKIYDFNSSDDIQYLTIDNTSRTTTVTFEDGSIVDVEIITAFELTDVKREYIVYTKNEIDKHGNVEIFVSQAVSNEEDIFFDCVEECDWGRIKNILRELSKDENSEYTPPIYGTFYDKYGNEILI